MTSNISLFSSTNQVSTVNAAGVTGSSVPLLSSNKLQPKILCGKLHRDNRHASDWGWQNLFAYGCHTHVAIVDPAYLHIVQTLDEHRHNVCVVRWSRDIHCSAQTTSVRLATADTGGTILIWDVIEAAVLQSFHIASAVGSGGGGGSGGSTGNSQSEHSLSGLTSSSSSTSSGSGNTASGSGSSSGDHKHTTIKDIQWLPNDPSLILVLTSNSLTLWNVQSGMRVWRRDLEYATTFQLDPFIDNRVLIGIINGSIYSVDLTESVVANHSSCTAFGFGSSNHINMSHSGDSLPVHAPTLEFIHHVSPQKSIANSTGGTAAAAKTSELLQMVCSPISKNIVYYVFQRELVVYDISSNQLFGAVSIERNKSNFQSIVLCRENPYLMFSLHDDGSITSWSRRTDNNYNTHSYEQLCVSDLSHFHKKSKKKGQQLFSITHHPYNEQTILSIAGDGIIWKWDFTSEILYGGQQQFVPRLNSLTLKPLNGVIKLGVSGTSDCVSHPISSMSVYPFANRANMSLIVVGTVNGTIQLLNATTLRVQKELFIWQHPVYGLKWLSPGRVICYSYEEVETGRVYHNRMAIVDLRSGRVKEFRLVATNETSPVRGLRLSFSRKFLVILLKDRPFELWETKRFTCLRSFKQYPQVAGLEWVPPRDDSETALSPDTSRYETREQFIFFNAESGGSIKCCTIEGNSVTLVDIAIEGSALANVMGGAAPQLAHALKRDLMVAGDAAGNIHVWSSERKKPIHHISTHKSAIKKIRFSPAPNTSDIMVLFTSGEISIYDLSTGSRTATGNYLSERDIKAIDIEWLTDSNPIVISADNSIRILDSTLCLTNSRINNVIGGSSSNNNNIFEGFIYSPLLLSPFCAMQLRHLLHGCRLDPQTNAVDLGKSQATSMLLLDQLEKTTRLMSLVDDRLITLLSGSNVPECSLAVAQFFGDYQQIKFWRLVIHTLQTMDRSLYTPGQSIYNQECLAYYEQLPLIPPIPTKNNNNNNNDTNLPTPSTINMISSPSIASTTSINQSSMNVTPPIPAANNNNNISINQSSVISPLSTSPLSTPVKSLPPTTAAEATPQAPTSLTKKQSIASFFGGFAQGLASKATGNTMAKEKEAAKPTTVQLSPTTQSSSSPIITHHSNVNTATTTSNLASTTNTMSNPLSISQSFHSVVSQLQQSQLIDFDTLQQQHQQQQQSSDTNNSPMNSSLADSSISMNDTLPSSTLPIYYDTLCDSSTVRSTSLERLDLQERKKLPVNANNAAAVEANDRISKSLIENNILVGRAPRAVALLLDTTPDHPDFYSKAIKASMIAASISSECYQTTMKLLADNLIAVGKIDEGVQFLCLIDKVLDACRYLQGAQRWNEAAQLAKNNLSDDEVKVVYRQWAIHLATTEKHYQKATEIFLTLGDFYSVIQLLYSRDNTVNNNNNNYYYNNNNNNQLIDMMTSSNSTTTTNKGKDSVFSPIPNLTDEFTLEQLIQIIFKEHGNLLHQLCLSQSTYYWHKSVINKVHELEMKSYEIGIAVGVIAFAFIIGVFYIIKMRRSRNEKSIKTNKMVSNSSIEHVELEIKSESTTSATSETNLVAQV
ncbi:hypothetical protein PPL_06582 [Heterostelium album PN500]|uniref:WD40 repeat-containing protein n=1 Tax=Heterostelium pallidum (strain ATCC 26659 / Pp 5 / PN500) TaxID=670386 RepID=D3BF49_HETP5|nr:hypothetical protein PPL_06582 [Heterostelium album PN500]EFA79763.1 hypothetical protein PPL_06582 [Heterostelium album PN500]|eukprot:XP_020431884.1 hypothetical protein PPL_06582 [Heterostelium album PN500]